MGTKDTPKVIDYILELTNRTNLTYVGHQQGATQILAGASLMPEFYFKKINCAILLSPITSLYKT